MRRATEPAMLAWCDDINGTFVQKLYTEMLRGTRLLVLNSRGGEIDHMVAAIDILEATEPGWSIVATGSIMSAAVPIVACGAKGNRIATRRARFMVHVPRLYIRGEMVGSEIDAERAELKLAEDHYVEVLGEHTKRSAAWWRAKVRGGNDWYFDAYTAAELGIVDAVIDARGAIRRGQRAPRQ